MKLKTKILVSLVLSSILFSSHASANAITAASEYMAEHPDKVAKAKEALKFGFKHAKNIPKGTAVVVAGKTVKTVVKHPFLASGAFAAYATYSILSVDNAVFQIARQPDALDNYLEKNPTKIDKFINKTIYNYENSKNNEDQKNYSNLLSLLLISTDTYNENESPALYRSLQDQQNLEKTNAFSIEIAKLKSIANDYDKKNPKKCNIQIASLLVTTAPSIFYRDVRPLRKLMDINDRLANKYNTDQYGRLKGLKNILESDHIPSYKSLELFFKKHNVSFIDPITQKPLSKKDGRYTYLVNNATAVTIDYDLHRNNRTTYKNSFASTDKDDLREATLKDYATLLSLSKNNLPQYYRLLKSFVITYSRNKNMCLYDI